MNESTQSSGCIWMIFSDRWRKKRKKLEKILELALNDAYGRVASLKMKMMNLLLDLTHSSHAQVI